MTKKIFDEETKLAIQKTLKSNKSIVCSNLKCQREIIINEQITTCDNFKEIYCCQCDFTISNESQAFDKKPSLVHDINNIPLNQSNN